MVQGGMSRRNMNFVKPTMKQSRLKSCFNLPMMKWLDNHNYTFISTHLF